MRGVQGIRLVEVVDMQLPYEALEVRMFEMNGQHLLNEDVMFLNHDHLAVCPPVI
jgi:hypothetical protein